MSVSVGNDIHFVKILRTAGFRATFGRVSLLEALSKAKEPLAVEELAKSVGKHIDVTNVYRALEAFAEAGIVRRVDVGHQHMHYTLAPKGPHKHQYVCAQCGVANANYLH